MFHDVISLLGRMNLKPKDAGVYMACLHARDGLFVHEIVRQTKIKRSTVDVILHRLLDMRFVSRIKNGSRYKFLAERPESILFRQEELVSDFRTVMPLLAKLGSTPEEIDIRFFEGKKGLQQIYADMLLKLKFAEGERRQIVSFVSGIETLKIFPDLQTQFIDKRIKMGVWYRAVVPHSSLKAREYSPNPVSLRNVKAIDDTRFPFKATFETYGDSVMIYSPVKPFGGVVIRNARIADSMRSLFYLVWNLLPEV